jgi:uncharacterized protein (DUF1800 family)
MSLFILHAGNAFGQRIDLNGNGMSDVWEVIYNAAALNPNLDTDNDHVVNRLENIANTNPFDTNSVPRIPMVAYAGGNFTASLLSHLGKKYELQSVISLGSSNWIAETSTVARTGSVVSLVAPATVAPKFFRVVISDVDTDGDGLNDWEEYQMGLDPLVAASSGQLDGNGQPMGDFAYATAQLSLENMVSITAADPTAVQPAVGEMATSFGMFTVTRGGFPLNEITVNLGLGGPGAGFAVEGVDHEVLTRPVTLPAGASSQTITLTPKANTNRVVPVVASMKVQAGSGYTISYASNATVVIYPSTTPKGTGLTAQYYTNSSSTYSNPVNLNPTNLLVTRIDPVVDFVAGVTNTSPITNGGRYTVRWTGQVQPQYSETYFFETRTDDGLKLWVNDVLVIDRWSAGSPSTATGTIALQADVRYNLKMEYYVSSGVPQARLSWYSESQPRQVVPTERLYPTNAAAAVVTSPLEAFGFLGQPFSFTVTGANSPSGYSVAGLPPGLSFSNAVISGVPALAGYFQVTLTASNAVGLGASVVNVTVFDTGSAVTREVWTNAPGTNVSDIPIGLPPSSVAAYGSMQGITDFGDNYGERIRGYLTVPATGNYTFWLAAANSAELWISNDDEPVNKIRRARVSPNGTAPLQWNLYSEQKSQWLSLIAGQRYYFEILHKAGVGAGDHWAVGWRLDPTGTNTIPSAIVPAHLLSRHFDQPPAFIPGTLYGANMLAQAGAISSGVGSATLRVSADESQAVLKFNYSGLTTPVTAKHIHSDAYLTHPSQIIFDIDAASPQPDGSYVWEIASVGTLTAAEIREIIKEGKTYINIHSINYPAGEINGHFTLAVGSQNFTPPPPEPLWSDDHSNAAAAARFLIQSTFGPSSTEIASVQSLGFEGWIDDQMLLPISQHLPDVVARQNYNPTQPFPSELTLNTWWKKSITAPDQLRQRVAFALSEIMVVSQQGVLEDRATALSSYYDVLLEHSFGNFRELLEAVTLTPAMGLYLDMRGNQKGDIAAGRHPNENFAREILQLFSIGLYRMWPDGTLVMNSEGSLVPTYDQDVILGFSRVFTGWNYYQNFQTNGRLPASFGPPSNYTNAMVLVPTRHELGTKRVLNNVILPAAFGSNADPASVSYDLYCLNDLELALDSIFYNDNVGPFFCRQLIQRLVTSHPSRDYLYRVVQKFNDNGSGVRGDMKAVIKAILLDYEARSSLALAQPTFGKLREPLCRVTAPARAFAPPAPLNGTYSEPLTRVISVATPTPHRLTNSENVMLTFTDTSGNAPPMSQAYAVTIVNPTNFTVNATGISPTTYGQSGTTISVTNSGHGLATNYPVYLVFNTGGASNGLYTVNTVPTTSAFTVIAPDSATRTGAGAFAKLTGGYVQFSNTITLSVSSPHGLNQGENVYINFTSGSAVDGQYQVDSVVDLTRFKVTSLVLATQTQDSVSVFPMVPPPLPRSGNVAVQYGTWNLNFTEGSSSSSLSQSPLNSPTVFNYFFPDFKFPGTLASAGLTTPEFQLTSDTEVVLQMNFLTGGIQHSGNNTNGLSSFTGGNGSIVLDLSAWTTQAYTSNAGIPNLVDELNTLLCAGQLSASAKTTIVNYVTTTSDLPYGSPPTGAQMRDRARAVVHLIVNSPDFTVQR